VGRLTALVDRMLLRWLRAASPTAAAPAPLLDLHGLGVQDALAATARFLADARRDGIVEVRIVYGKGRHSPGGRGVLREVVPRWLAAEGRAFVESAVPETDGRGEDAAIRVRLRAHAARDPP
jgi:DNA-nicking Smr family endonuclease